VNNASRIACTVKFGYAWIRQATAPAMSGVDSEVPLPFVKSVVLDALIVSVPEPRARTSGLTRPSAVGPSELNDAMFPEPVTAPAVMTKNASDGAMRCDVAGSESWPSLPAAVTVCTPKSLAALIAIVVTAVSPSRSACVYQSMYPSEEVVISAPCASRNSRPAT
jgi:hypothetical protein